MEPPESDVLTSLFAEARFDSQGEFQVDLARAREKLDQHLGLWPEDYLAFLIQGAYALGSHRLQLSATWHTVVWEFDGPALTRSQLECLRQTDMTGQLPSVLQRFQMALYLLGKSRYKSYRLSAGLGNQGVTLERKGKSVSIRDCRRNSSWSNSLELTLPFRQVNIHWMLSRRQALTTLPEYASVRLRYKDGPLRLVVPWKSPRVEKEEVPLSIALHGRVRLAEPCPMPSQLEFHQSIEADYSCWLALHLHPALRCLVYSLGYQGPTWDYGCLWLYCDELRTDLGQRQLVTGPLLNSVLQDARQRLALALKEALAQEGAIEACRSWILWGLTQWIRSGGDIGRTLAELPFFRMAYRPDFSLIQLDEVYASQGQVLYFCTEIPENPPENAPPVVILEPEIASLLRLRFPELRPCAPLFAALSLRNFNREQWSLRKEESLELTGVKWLQSLQEMGLDPGWQGHIGLMASEVPPRLDVFLEHKWLASVTLGKGFPPGLLGRVQHPDLEVNPNWTEPAGPLWTRFKRDLGQAIPAWLASLCNRCQESWLLDRTYEVLLNHPQSPDLDGVALVPVGKRRASLLECQQALRDSTWCDWVLEGWQPRDRGWRLLNRLIHQEDELRAWKIRLEAYQKGFENWQKSPRQPARLSQRKDLVAVVPLPEDRGEIGLQPLERVSVQVTVFRQGRPLGSNVVSAAPLDLGGLPEGLVVALNQDLIRPNLDWTQALLEGPPWEAALETIWREIPALAIALLESSYPERMLASLRLWAWLPANRWAHLNDEQTLCYRLDGQRVGLATGLQALLNGPPVSILVDPVEKQCFPGLEQAWVLSRELQLELASHWGPSRLQDVQGEYLVKMLALEHAQATPVEARLNSTDWLLTQSWEIGQVGLRAQVSPANRCFLKLLRQGHPLLEHGWPLVDDAPEFTSQFRLEAVVDWPEAPLVQDFSELSQHPWMQKLRDRLRLFGFDQPDKVREFLLERLAFEAGAREGDNTGFSGPMDEVRRQILEIPIFSLAKEHWSLRQLYQHLREEGRLNYVVSEQKDNGSELILYLSTRELRWLRLLLGNTQLLNLSHLRNALKLREKMTRQPRLQELPLPDLDYLVKSHNPHCRWGLQRELNGISRVRIFRHMRRVDALDYDWRYQVQACLNLNQVQVGPDGHIVQDQNFQEALSQLKEEIQAAILTQTPRRYRLELALWSRGVPESWAEQLQQQPLLREPRGQELSLQEWVDAWDEDGHDLPYLLEEQDWSGQLELLPKRAVPLLPGVLVAVAGRTLRGLLDYREGLGRAWHWNNQPATDLPGAATYQWEEGPIQLYCEHLAVEQLLIFRWRGRIVQRLLRRRWPGFRLEVDWSERLLMESWPSWDHYAQYLAPYWRYLQALLLQPNLLESDWESWDALPVEAQAGVPFSVENPDEEHLRLLLGRRKNAWRLRQRGRHALVQRLAELWWNRPVEVEEHDGPEALSYQSSNSLVRLRVNSEHRWFRHRSPETVALRICCWLQSREPHRDSVERRNRILTELNYIL